MVDRFIKVRYSERESGFVEQTDEGLWKIANIPIDERLNIDDLVTLKKNPQNDLIVDQIISNKFPNKIAARVQKNQFQLMHQEEDAQQGGEYLFKFEHMLRGLVLIAYTDSFDIKKFASRHGIQLLTTDSSSELKNSVIEVR